MSHTPAGMLTLGEQGIPFGSYSHQEPAEKGSSLGSHSHQGNVAAGFIWVHLESQCRTMGRAAAPGLHCPWKVCKTFNLCRSLHPLVQNQESESPKGP